VFIPAALKVLEIMAVSELLTGQLRMLRERQLELRGMCEQALASAKRSGRDTMNARETAMLGELRQINARVKHAESELARAGDPAKQIFGEGRQPGQGPAINSAGRLAPMGVGVEELRKLQSAALRGESCRIESRAFSTADPLLPAQLWSVPIAAVHEARLLDRLPGVTMTAPSIEFVRHVSTTGSAGVVAEGQAKPELVWNVDALTATAVKIAGHVGLTWEILNDWEAFSAYSGTELYLRLIDAENAELIQGGWVGGSPPTSGMVGFLATSGVLSYDASSDTGGSGAASLTALDAIEKAMRNMRTGPALATPNLMVFHPNTFSAIRRVKDGFGHFLVAPDPTQTQTNELWGIECVQTTQMPSGYGLLLDREKFGYIAVREPLSMRVGYSGNDLVNNVLRTVAEERLALCITRPPAVMVISNLPTS
jgi:HK97 family phage major capsid protein